MRQGLNHPLPGWYGFAQHEPLHCWWGKFMAVITVEVSTQMKNPQKDSPKVHHFPKYFHMIWWNTFFWPLKIESTCRHVEFRSWRSSGVRYPKPWRRSPMRPCRCEGLLGWLRLMYTTWNCIRNCKTQIFNPYSGTWDGTMTQHRWVHIHRCLGLRGVVFPHRYHPDLQGETCGCKLEVDWDPIWTRNFHM